MDELTAPAVLLRLVEGQERSVLVERHASGLRPYAVRERDGARVWAAPDELDEAIEAVTGVHHARAQRLAALARARLTD